MKIKKRYLYAGGIILVIIAIIAWFFLIRVSHYPYLDSPRPILGNPDAPLVIKEYSDFQCPACGMAFLAIEEIVREYGEKIRFEYHHFPLEFHEFAFQASLASECANDQGKFFEYAGILYHDQAQINEKMLYTTADTLGLDHASFRSCLKSQAKADLIYKEIAEGQRLGLPGTPTFYINGKMIDGWNHDTFKKEIETFYKTNAPEDN